ncbi:TRAP transporter large permease [Ruixingdingia sedimenti]|uniref:TRAP transporter large permease n=1 Tax=Ruixingdingia sedimenti TaxID=3073604 RepID=A0ABU1F9S9_9RHOB|nr:TRAP transporter large permease [Xinfangfangia sp. LG-4]MDR5653177.1 TRAP transporter large permease [Xinfangfangia sp. LG-4]
MVEHPILWLAGAFLAMLALIFVRIPIGIAMAIVGVAGTAMIIGFGPALSLLAVEPANAVNSADLATIPLFLLMGNLATAAGISGDIFKVAQNYMGHFRGGMAMATIAGSAGYGAICGSSSATTAAMARIALPEMEKRGYAGGLAAATIATGGGLGILIPPSIIMVLYAVLTEQFVLELFAAGIVPGILAVILYQATVWLVVSRNPALGPATDRVGWAGRLRSTLRAWRAVLTILLVIVGIYSGAFTVLEAAAVGVAITGGFWVFSPARGWASLRAVFADTAALTGMMIVMVIGASAMGYLLTLTNAPLEIVDAVAALGVPAPVVMVILLVMYIFLGMVFDSISAMVLTIPFVFPLVVSLGYDPVWWGIINVMIVEIALITPPVGMNVFIMHAVAPHIRIGAIFRAVMPFVLADVVWLGLMLAFPVIALWLPHALR